MTTTNKYQIMYGYFKEGNHKDCLGVINDILSSNATDYLSQKIQIAIYCNNDSDYYDGDKAIELCRKLMSCYPSAQSIQLLYAFVQKENLNHEDAVRTYETVLNDDPGCYEALVDYADTLMYLDERSNSDKIIKALKHATMIYPSCYQAYERLGMHYYSKKMLNECIDNLKTALLALEGNGSIIAKDLRERIDSISKGTFPFKVSGDGMPISPFIL